MSWSTVHRILRITRAPGGERRAALSSQPLETLRFPEHAAAFVAGGRETVGALPVKTAKVDGAVFSSRGRQYLKYNEDAAGMFFDQRGAVYICVLDQAGKLGGKVRGGASQLAGLEIADAFQRIASSPAQLDAEVALDEIVAAFERAHRRLIDRGENEVTTAIAAIVRPGELLVASSGDCGVALFDAAGEPRSATRLQRSTRRQDSYLEHALGLVEAGHEPERYVWPMSTGDWAVVASGGLLNSGLSPHDVGRHLRRSAEKATNSLASSVLRRMSVRMARPDNLSMAVARSLR